MEDVINSNTSGLNYTICENFILPSKGLIYDSPVNPNITLRAMTTAEEMLRLADTDTPYKNMCDMIDACLIKEKPGISSYDMCLGDYQFLLHKLRIVTYGKDYRMMINCPHCHKTLETVVDMETLPLYTYDPSIKDMMSIILPVSKKKIEFRLQTPRILDQIEILKRERSRQTKDTTKRFDYIITLVSLIKTIDGQTYNSGQLESFVLGLNMKDVNYLVQKADKLNQKVGLDTNVIATCPDCKKQLVTTFRITAEFFGPRVD